MADEKEVTTMAQPSLGTEKSWLVVLLSILAFSSFGFALLGLTIGPELSQEAGLHRTEKTMLIPGGPDLVGFSDFWEKRDFHLVKTIKDIQLEPGGPLNPPEFWVQGKETWVLAPGSFEADLTAGLWELVDHFLQEGWSIQLEIEEERYIIGFWNTIPGYEGKILAYLWELELLNPKNYNEYWRGFVPVMGTLFDPRDYLRGTKEAPVLALVIDDWGYPTSEVEPMLAFPLPLTMAVLPHLPLSSEVGKRAYAAGHEVILHQPMEPLDSSLDLGPGGITVQMEQAEKVRQLVENIQSIPNVVGLNNHMGSKATEDYETMAAVLETVKELELFFLDSHTSRASIVPEVARALEVPFSVNNLFIDNENEPEKIKAQLRKGLELAERQGQAVLIGHVRPATAQALWEMIPEFLASKVELVPISTLVY